MKNNRNFCYSLLIILAGGIYLPVQAQQKKDAQDVIETKVLNISHAPNSIVRTIKQDRHGNIWMASWAGVIKYDGKSFSNITGKVSPARFFSILEDRMGNFWFASVGSGVYHYDGKSFRNYTTRDGLANDRVTNIYEDKTGQIWFGTEGGASLYNGKSFRNFKMNEAPPFKAADSVHVSVYQKSLPEVSWMHHDVNAVIEDNTGKFWLATRGHSYWYDGKTFTKINNNEGKPFLNVRSIIKDQKGHIWLGGADGLWRYDGKTFTNFTQKFVGYIYEDRKGNIWTSSESAKSQNWVLSRYDEKSLLNKKPMVTEIKTNDKMLFGILEAKDGNIWFGGLKGVYRYDASLPDGQQKSITHFKGKEAEQ
ncbi:ligand-binding sensor domain-containing protein [Pedobacter sp. GR22-10]|uniref:ligand-binding sensor domain-containing protein n=1 Tax=Pedobacter sp. GR22-10 TaxID=2994472 RepID=UPI002247ABD4|nr:two-component regulator propeller domain-containing protein [Pedobacter sp. GR22-10]MCX2429531.1 histidine kinase [Pedobacter sp. GR22-10]